MQANLQSDEIVEEGVRVALGGELLQVWLQPERRKHLPEQVPAGELLRRHSSGLVWAAHVRMQMHRGEVAEGHAWEHAVMHAVCSPSPHA